LGAGTSLRFTSKTKKGFFEKRRRGRVLKDRRFEVGEKNGKKGGREKDRGVGRIGCTQNGRAFFKARGKKT